MKGGSSPQASGEYALLSWNGDSLDLLAPGDLPAEARLVYDANMQSKPLFTKPFDRQLLQAPDPVPCRTITGRKPPIHIYLITICRIERKYVGQTVDVTARFNRHMSQLKKTHGSRRSTAAFAKAANTRDFRQTEWFRRSSQLG